MAADLLRLRRISIAARIDNVRSCPLNPVSIVPVTIPIAAMAILLASLARAIPELRAPVRRRNGRRAHPQGRSEARSEEHTSELQSLMRISYAAFCLKKKKQTQYKASVIT